MIAKPYYDWIIDRFAESMDIDLMEANIQFDLQPMLNGNLLIIRPLRLSDFEELYKIASDPLIWDQHPFPRYEKAAFAEFFELALESKGALIILDRLSAKVIGTSRYYNFNDNQISIGYTFLARSHWGGKFNRELKSKMVGHALQYVSQVYFDIGEENLRSRRAIEKIGATFVKSQTIKAKPYTLYMIDKKII